MLIHCHEFLENLNEMLVVSITCAHFGIPHVQRIRVRMELEMAKSEASV